MDPEVDLALQTASHDTAYSSATQLKQAFSSMNELREQDLLCDVTLVTNVSDAFPHSQEQERGDDCAELRCHKLVLAASSPYFRAMFTNEGFPEAHSGRITLQQVDSEALRVAVDYMYTGCCEITESNAFSLLALSSLMQMDELCSACCDFLQLNMNTCNCLAALRLGELHCCVALHSYALRFIAANFSAVSRDTLFADALSLDAFCTLLRNDRLAVTNEDEVFEAAVRWLVGSTHSAQRLQHSTVRRVLEYVRMPLLTGETLLKLAQDETFAFVREADSEKRWLIEALAFHLRKNKSHTDSENLLTTTAALTEANAANLMQTSTGEAVDNISVEQSSSETIDDELLKSNTTHFAGNSVRYRARCASTASASRMLIMLGGQSSEAMRDVEAYSFRSARWQHLTTMPTKRARHGAAYLDGSVYVIGGFNGSQRVRTCERFDLQSREWQAAPPLNIRRCTVGCCVRGDVLFAVGGYDGQMGLATVELLVGGTWQQAASMSTRRSSVGVASVRRIDPLVAAVGGYDGSARQFLQTAELYDAGRDFWSGTCSMTSRRCGAAIAADDWCVYAVGGQDGPLVKNTVERLDVREGDWRLVAPMRFCRRNAAAVVNDADGCVYVCGGDDGRVHTDTVEAYDPRADAWNMLDSRMLIERSFSAATIVSL